MPTAETRPLRRDAAANRQRVLDAAVSQVLEHGEHVPMAVIAEAAGVGVGTIYRHFPTREALYAALVQQSLQLALANAQHAARVSDEPLVCIADFLRAAVRDRDRFVLPLHGGPPVVDDASRRLQRRIRTTIGQILERGRANGTIRDDVSARDVIITGALLSRGLPNSSGWVAIAHRQIGLFVAGLGATT